MKRRFSLPVSAFLFGIAFLYIPIVIMMIYSFNDSKLVMLWGGFSTRWYGEVFRNEFMIAAARRSFEIATIAASCAGALGTMAGYALARLPKFRGRTLFSGMIAAPLVMPDVITGISMLLMFISMAGAIGWPADRGMTTIAIAHITFCTAYVAVVVQSRLVSMDTSLEEAAMDLGAKPYQVLFDITLQIIVPALVAAWLLSFSLSLDDLVISSFVSGPSSTTLPLLIYSQVKLGVKPDVNALATIMIAIVSLAVAIAGFVMSRRERIRMRDEQLAFAAEAALQEARHGA